MHGSFPIKLGDRQEQFCQHIVRGLSHAAAYRLAYNVSQISSESAGPRLFGSVRVQARIEQLRAFEAAAARVSVPFLTKELLATAAESRALGQGSAAQACYMGIAKLHGLIIDRQQVDMIVRKPSLTPDSPDTMTEADWLGKHGLTIDHAPDNPTDTLLTQDIIPTTEEDNSPTVEPSIEP